MGRAHCILTQWKQEAYYKETTCFAYLTNEHEELLAQQENLLVPADLTFLTPAIIYLLLCLYANMQSYNPVSSYF